MAWVTEQSVERESVTADPRLSTEIPRVEEFQPKSMRLIETGVRPFRGDDWCTTVDTYQPI